MGSSDHGPRKRVACSPVDAPQLPRRASLPCHPGVRQTRILSVLTELYDRLQRQGCTIALSHLRQAESAFQRREWEAANAQVRSGLEALFDEVARIRLGSVKSGGAARKELEAHRVLRPREGALTKAFMDLAGSSGSHAGVSNEDEARGRILAGAGIAYLALGLIPELTRVEDIVGEKLSAPEGSRLPTDAEIRTECPACGQAQFLSEAEVHRDGEDTVYTCRNGCQTIVVISKPGQSPWPGRGYRIGEHVIRNARNILLPVIAAAGASFINPPAVLIPASPAALMKRRPDAPSA